MPITIATGFLIIFWQGYDEAQDENPKY